MEDRESLRNALLRDPITPLWRALASARAVGLLLACLALALLLSALIPQVPAEARGDVLAYNRWLAETRNAQGPLFGLWQAVGLLDIRASLGMRLLLATLALSIALRAIDLAARLHGWWRGELPSPLAEQALAGPWDADTAARLHTWLAARGYRTRLTDKAGQLELAAWRFPWRTALMLLAHAGALCLLAGLLLNGRLGWQEAQWPLSVGQRLPIGHGASLSLEGLEVLAEPGSDGRPAAKVTRLLVWEDGRALRSLLVGPQRPAQVRRILITQAALGPAVSLAALDAAGRPLEVQALSQPADEGKDVRFRNNGDERYLFVPAANLTLRLTYYDELPQRSEKLPQLHVEAYRSGQSSPIYDAFHGPDSAWAIGGIAYQMRSAPYALLNLRFLPGLWVMALGLALMLAGCGAFVARDRAAVIVGGSGELRLGAPPGDPLGRELAKWLGESR